MRWTIKAFCDDDFLPGLAIIDFVLLFCLRPQRSGSCRRKVLLVVLRVLAVTAVWCAGLVQLVWGAPLARHRHSNSVAGRETLDPSENLLSHPIRLSLQAGT